MRDQTALEAQQLVVAGDRSELVLEGGRFVLHKQATTQAEPTQVGFGVDRVRGASLEAPSRGGTGWLHLAVVGGSPPPPSALAAASDPYTLPLTSRGVGAARRLVKLVERHVQQRGMPSDSGQPAASTGVVVRSEPPSDRSAAAGDGAAPSDGSTRDDLVGRLRELAELHEVGALTDDEFARAKARLLA